MSIGEATSSLAIWKGVVGRGTAGLGGGVKPSFDGGGGTAFRLARTASSSSLARAASAAASSGETEPESESGSNADELKSLLLSTEHSGGLGAEPPLSLPVRAFEETAT
jgi:hypothetical protein